jgi:glutaryl-CoA dehydrogenase
MQGKGASRAIWQADIRLAGVRVPEESRLPGAERFKDAGRVLITTRTTCAWGALGHAVAAYDAALTYSKQRQQFGKPLCSFQIVQDRLVKMLAEVTGIAALLHATRAPGGDRSPVGHDRRPGEAE